MKCAAEQRSSQQQQLQMRILEKRAELERLQAEYRALQRTEQEQQEMIQHLLQH
ncbi:hypothetical protein B566_EDAN013170 [Ephemera danica]|nr:hypothetical protein B566_EDAN013170 [Ephemera danica]